MSDLRICTVCRGPADIETTDPVGAIFDEPARSFRCRCGQLTIERPTPDPQTWQWHQNIGMPQ